jgi:hypothetical protein
MGGLKLGKEAQAKYDEARIQPDIEGFLEKKGAKRKNWNTRWFVLKDNYLFYSKDNKTNPQGIINSHGCTVCKLEGVTVRPYSFSLLAPKSVSIDAKWTNRTYYLAAKDAKEMERWMKILDESGKKAMENAKKKQEVAAQAQTENNNKEKEEKEKSEKKDKEAKEKRKKKKHSKKKKVVKKEASDSEDSDAKNDRDASDEAENASENDKSGSDNEKKREDSYSYSEDEKDSEEEKKKKKKKKKSTKKSSSKSDVTKEEKSSTPSSERKKKSSRKKKASSEEEASSDEDSS